MTASFPAMVNRPSLIEYRQYRFLIMDAPTDANLPAYIDILRKKHTVALVRACEPTYRSEPVKQAGIRVLDLPFDDGDPPPEHMLSQWLTLVAGEFGMADAKPDKDWAEKNSGKHGEQKQQPPQSQQSVQPQTGNSELQHGDSGSSAGKKTVAVHCVAGLGRAPVLVAVALIEAGLQPFEAINFIRKKRRGAINARQLHYLESYKPKKRLRAEGGCVIC